MTWEPRFPLSGKPSASPLSVEGLRVGMKLCSGDPKVLPSRDPRAVSFIAEQERNSVPATRPVRFGNTMDEKRLVDINQLSRLISVPKGTLYNWCYLRRIPFVKAGRSLRFDVQAVIQSLPHFATIGSADQRWKGH
jgi:hypothetical protein